MNEALKSEQHECPPNTEQLTYISELEDLLRRRTSEMAKQVVQLEKCQKESEIQLEALISEQNENFEVMTNKLD